MNAKALALLFGTLILCSFSFIKLAQLEQKEVGNPHPEVLYLPAEKALEFISFGYRNTLAHFLWFHTNNYFGKHYRGDRNYDWLSHYCNLVTTLNPKNRDYYQFCGTMLSWEANRIEDSIAIFTRAIAAYPQDWLYYYFRGFTYAFFAQDDLKSQADFIKSATLPNANHFVARLASKQILANGSVEEAKEFLREAINMASDPGTKSILENRLRQMESSSPSTLKQLPWNRRSNRLNNDSASN
jgi:tetratricopeptide (TPR) repeat protein